MAQKKSHYSKKISLSGGPKSATEKGPDLGIPDWQSENRGMKKPRKLNKHTPGSLRSKLIPFIFF